jgi:acetyl esterase/lipase
VDLSAIDPEPREATARAPKLNLANPLVLRTISTLSRFAPGARVDQVDRRIVRDGGVRVRVYTPPSPSGAGLLWIHGGGLVLGSAATDDRMCSETALETGAIVVSVDYRLAPRHPFPAAIDDCADAHAWFLRNADDLGVDTARIAVGGQSAGGGLAAAHVQKLVDGGEPPIAQWLFCPMLDDRTATDRRLDAEGHFVWNNRSNMVGWGAYLGESLGAPTLPDYAAPGRREDLGGFPPTWLYTSTVELFYQEDMAYARRLEDAGAAVTLDVVPGAPHGFEAWAGRTGPALRLKARARAWLTENLG